MLDFDQFYLLRIETFRENNLEHRIALAGRGVLCVDSDCLLHMGFCAELTRKICRGLLCVDSDCLLLMGFCAELTRKICRGLLCVDSDCLLLMGFCAELTRKICRALSAVVSGLGSKYIEI